MDFKKLGSRLKSARINQNLTQEELAEKVNLSSVYISHIEHGIGKTSLETLVKLCNALQVTPDFLLLDSIYTSKEYLHDELAVLVKKCSPENMRLIIAIIQAIMENQQTN